MQAREQAQLDDFRPEDMVLVNRPANDIDLEEQVHEIPVAVFWCNEQQMFSIETVENWVNDKMVNISLVRDVHIYPLKVFENKEQAHHFVETMSFKKHLVLHRSQ